MVKSKEIWLGVGAGILVGIFWRYGLFYLLAFLTPGGGYAILRWFIIFVTPYNYAIVTALLLLITVIIKFSRSSINIKKFLLFGLIAAYAFVGGNQLLFLREEKLQEQAEKSHNQAEAALVENFSVILDKKNPALCSQVDLYRRKLDDALTELSVSYSGAAYDYSGPLNLFTSEHCRKILEGDYAYFTDPERNKLTIPQRPFQRSLQETAWFAIFDTLGYEQCMTQSSLELDGIPIGDFCNVRQALTTKNPSYCERVATQRGKGGRRYEGFDFYADRFTKQWCYTGVEYLTTGIAECKEIIQQRTDAEGMSECYAKKENYLKDSKPFREAIRIL